MELWPAHVEKNQQFWAFPHPTPSASDGRPLFLIAHNLNNVNLSIVSIRDKNYNAYKSDLGGRHGDSS